MCENWAKQEFGDADFSDKRIERRLPDIADAFYKNRSGNISKCSKIASEVKAAHRFFSNKKVTMAKIQEPHLKQTLERAKKVKFALNIQDTSGLNYYRHKSKTDTGHIGTSSKKKDSLGYWLHSGLMCDEDGLALGISYQEVWARKKVHRNETADERKVRLRRVPIAEKESQRWLTGVEECQIFRDHNIKVVQLCDREADIFEFMHLCEQVGDGFVVRAKSNRAIVDFETETKTSIFENIKTKKIKATAKLKIIGNSERSAKAVNVGIRWCEVEVQVPSTNRSCEAVDSSLKPIKLNVIMVSSKSKLEGKPILWILLTNMPITTGLDAQKIVNWYSLRWRIEIFHKVLKSGLGIEECRLENLDRMSNYLILKSIVACKIMLFTYYIREHPNHNARLLFDDEELRLLQIVLFPTRKPTKNIAIKDVIIAVANHGGFFANGNRQPGVTAIWHGWQAVSNKLDFLTSYFIDSKSLVGSR